MMQRISDALPPFQSPSDRHARENSPDKRQQAKRQSQGTVRGGTTPVPNTLLDTVMPTLSDTELRVLLVVVRSTLGWRAGEAGLRKECDWISHRQFQRRTGRAGAAVSKAIDSLVRGGFLVVHDEAGKQFDTAVQRRSARGRLFYNVGYPVAHIGDMRGEMGSEYAPELVHSLGSASQNGLHKAKTTKETETKEDLTKWETTTEVSIDLSSLQSEVITVGFQELQRLKPHPQQELSSVTNTESMPAPFDATPIMNDVVHEKGVSVHHEKAVENAVGISQSGHLAVACSRFIERFAAAYRSFRPTEAMPPIVKAELQQLSIFIESYGTPMLERWIPAFFACQFGYVRRRKWSLGAYLESVFVLQAQNARTAR